MRTAAAAALAELGRPDIRPEQLVADLSVADQQLVEIARAIAVGCRVLVLDEPTSTLGRSDAERLFALIARLKARGHSVVYISHFIDEVREVCDRIVVLARRPGRGRRARDDDAGRDRAVDGGPDDRGSVPAHAASRRRGASRG